MAPLPPTKRISRHGSRWAVKNNEAVTKVRTKNTVDEKVSSEKFVGGDKASTRVSCKTEKSAIEFWRSRILRKKSFDVSLAGLMVFAGANAGPSYE